MKDDKGFNGNVYQALYYFKDNGKNNPLWQHPEFAEQLNQLDAIKRSISILKKHLPKRYHNTVRFSQHKHVWQLHVEKNLVSHQLNMLLDELSLRIAKDIGYAPRLKVIVTPANWKTSGFPLFYTPPTQQKTPSKAEAQQILNDFINGKDR